MKLTYSWLLEHLETSADVQTLADKLSSLGLVVDSLTFPGEALKGFKIAEILSAEQHPNADRLRVCRVHTGTEELQIVCGAPNARAGLRVVLALPGMTIPANGITLKLSEIRGVQSQGMLCSAAELGLSEDAEGIIELPLDAPVGAEFAPWAGLDDPILDVEITPNRGDCLGVRGLARDLAATKIGTLKPLKIPAVKGSFASPTKITIDLPDPAQDACSFFVGRVIRGVKNQPSPEWLQRRLKAIGLRPISALVDITNWMTYDMGRPMHVFDLNKLSGHLTVRLAREGDELLALDGKTYTLNGSMTVVADERGAQAIGGIMGGEETGCTLETTDVFLEAALFAPVRTAETGRQLNIHSDARARFERGVDPAVIKPCIDLATDLILQICGGEASEMVSAGSEPTKRRTLEFPLGRVKSLGGLDLDDHVITAQLEALGFQVAGSGETRTVTVPSWRNDIEGSADLVEEVLRTQGYDSVPVAGMPKVSLEELKVENLTTRLTYERVSAARRALAARGLHEALTWSFLAPHVAEHFGGGAASLTLQNPISADLAVMRPTLLPNLLQALQRNADRGVPGRALFEAGHAYGETLSQKQTLVVAGARQGEQALRHWAQAARVVDVFDAKADAMAAIAAMGFEVGQVQIEAKAPSWYHPGRCGAIKLGPKVVLAYFGEIHPKTAEFLGLDGPVVAFEVMVEAIPAPKAGAKKSALTLSAYQPVSRDLALLVADEVPAQQLITAVRKAEPSLITDISIFDVYKGSGVPAGMKSVAISFKLEPKDRTMTDQEIQDVTAKVLNALKTNAGAELRA
ncbi:MAG: phenylalanine--tRNA ligase subunit beta [Holosporales bacterium]